MVPKGSNLKVKNTLISQLLPRYFAVPQVQQWLLDRTTAVPQTSADFERGLSYACMYFPLASLPPGLSAPFPTHRPFLDIGDFILCQKFYDGIAVGTVYKEDERHTLANMRNHLFPQTPQLSSHPRVRRFAVDMRKDHMEIIEFAWMSDDSLIVSCRQMRPADDKQLQSYLMADILFYPPQPQSFQFSLTPYLWLSLEETPTICLSCHQTGPSVCTCPPSVKQRMIPTSIEKPNYSTVASSVNEDTKTSSPNPSFHRDENRLEDTWKNYHHTIFSSKQAGNFYASWCVRDTTGQYIAVRNPSQPIPYQFVTGTQDDTIHLISRYLANTNLGQTPRMSRNVLGSFSLPSDQQWLLSGASNEAIIPNATITQASHSSPSRVDHSNLQTDEDNLTHNQIYMASEVSEIPASNTKYEPIPQLSISNPEIHIREPISIRNEFKREKVIHSPEDAESPPISIQSAPPPRIHDSLPTILQGEVPTQFGISTSQPARLPVSEPPRTDDDQETKKFMSVNENNDPMCLKCHRAFRKRGNLVRHIENVHLKKKPYRCSLCLTRFGYNYHLKRHYQSKHHVRFDHKCPICGHDAGDNNSLVQHLFRYHNVPADQSVGSQMATAFPCNK